MTLDLVGTRLDVHLFVPGRWEPNEDGARLGQAWRAFAGTSLGQRLALDRPLAPADVRGSESLLSFYTSVDGTAFSAGLEALLVGNLDDLLGLIDASSGASRRLTRHTRVMRAGRAAVWIALMGSLRSTLAVGRFAGATATRLESASRSAGLDFNQVDSISEALTWAEQNEPHSLLLDGTSGNLERSCLEVRAQVRHALVPIIALAPVVNELAFAEVFSCGGDDVVGIRNNEALTSRLRRLPIAPWERPAPAAEKTALISASDRNRRIVLARVLSNAGYPIRFAVDLDETDRFSREAPPRLVVIDTELEGVQALITKAAPRNRNLSRFSQR